MFRTVGVSGITSRRRGDGRRGFNRIRGPVLGKIGCFFETPPDKRVGVEALFDSFFGNILFFYRFSVGTFWGKSGNNGMTNRKSMLFSLLLLLQLLLCGCAKGGALPSGARIGEAYDAAAQNLVSSYGMYSVSGGGEPSGFIRGMLLDLDGDGTDELLCFYRTKSDTYARVELFKYQGGRALPLLDAQAGEGFGAPNGSSGLFLNTVGGKTYLLVDRGRDFVYQHMYAYRLVGGVLTHTEFYAQTTLTDASNSKVSLGLCSVDGQEVDSGSYVSQYLACCSGMQSFLFDSAKNRNCTADDAQAFLASLKAMDK